MPARSRRFPTTLLVAVLVASGAVACRQAEPIPRIEPTLYNWHEHYRSAETPRVHVFDTGRLSLPGGFIQHGGNWFSARTLAVPAFVIEHPSKGLIVFDTGLSTSVGEERGRYMGLLWATLVPVAAAERQDLASQMRASGLAPEDVAFVVLSDLHFDHAGGVEEFPNAQVVVARSERQAALNDGWHDWYFPSDYDDVPRWLEIDYGRGAPFATFTAHHDLLGDGSVVLVDLHGHSAGSQGVVVRTESGPVLLTGDAAPAEDSWRYAARPAYAFDPHAWWEQAWRIKKFVDLVPTATVIAGHDLRALARTRNSAIEVHSFERSSPESGVGVE